MHVPLAYARWLWLLVTVALIVIGAITFSSSHAGAWLFFLILSSIPLRIVAGKMIPPWLEPGKQRFQFTFLLWYAGCSISMPLFVLAMGWFHVLTGGASQAEIQEFLVDASLPLAWISNDFLLDPSKSLLDACGVVLGNAFFYALATFAAWRGVRKILRRNRVTLMNIESQPDLDEDDL